MPKTAIVTGASRGIGFHIAKSLAQKKQKVIAVARTEEALQELHKQYPGYIKYVPTDLTSEEDLNILGNYISDNISGIDIVVNNAGKLINKPFEELSLQDWRSMLDTNLLTSIALIKTILPYLNKQAHIVNISSMGGFQGSSKFRGLSAYSTAKGAVGIFSECLAVELKTRSIKTNALCLGAVQTEMLAEAFPGFEAPVAADEMGKYIAHFALNGSHFYNGKILPVAMDNPE